MLEASFAKIEVKAVVAFVSRILNRHLPASVALDLLLGLAGLNDHLDPMLVRHMTPHLQALIGSGEVTILAQAEMRAVGAYKAGPNDRLHVAPDALVLVMRSQPVC